MRASGEVIFYRQLPAICRSALEPAGKWNINMNAAFSMIVQNLEEADMNWDQIKGQWMQLKGKAKEKWGDLTDDDLDKVEGKRDQLAGKVQEKYGTSKEEAERQVDEWSNNVR